jgi:tetratricopeptide (TPR) repeat protein
MRFADLAVLMEGVPVSSTRRSMTISEHLHELLEQPNSYFNLLGAANVYWREKKWPEAIEFALRALRACPNSFHATKVLVSAYAETAQYEECHRYAKQLVQLGLPNWRKAKVIGWLLSLLALFPRGRSLRQHWAERWKLEESSDRAMFSFAKEFVQQHEKPRVNP